MLSHPGRAGFTRDQLEITVEDSQLVIRGRQQDDKSRDFLFGQLTVILHVGEKDRLDFAWQR